MVHSSNEAERRENPMPNPNASSDSVDPIGPSEEQTAEAYEAPQLQSLNEENEGDFWCD